MKPAAEDAIGSRDRAGGCSALLQHLGLRTGLGVMLSVMLAAACLHPGTADAQTTRSVRFLSAGALHERLSSTDRAAVEAGRHYVMGIVDTLLLLKDPQVCVGVNAQLDSVVELVKTELAGKPQMHRYNAASFVREVLYTHLKCT